MGKLLDHSGLQWPLWGNLDLQTTDEGAPFKREDLKPPWRHWNAFFDWYNCVHAQLRLTPCDPMDCSLPGSSVHGILQARILEWVDMPSSRGLSGPEDQTHPCLLHLLHCRRFLYC